MKNSYNFFKNTDCEYYPCHNTDDTENFNCLFCFCPLYQFKDCGGNFSILSNGIKDCTNCSYPHYDYDGVIDKLMRKKTDNAQIVSEMHDLIASLALDEVPHKAFDNLPQYISKAKEILKRIHGKEVR